MASSYLGVRYATALGTLLISTSIALAQQVPAAESSAAAEPPLPNVSDPMLEPPPPPPHVLKTWQEAVSWIRRASTNVRTAEARIRQAEAEARQALAPALPQLEGHGQTFYNILNRSSNPLFNPPSVTYSGGGSITLPLLNAAAWYNHGTARDAVDSARLSALDVERREVALVANSIVTVITAERLAEVSRVSLQSALSTLDLNRRRAELGASSSVDVLRAEQEASISRAQVVSADENLRRAREALGLALGTNEAWGIAPDIQLDALMSDAQKTCSVNKDVQQRTDIRAAQASLKVSERRVKGVDYEYLPTIHAISNLEGNKSFNETLVWNVGAQLSWLIYDGGLRGATSRVRQAETDTAREQLTATTRQASVEVTQAVRSVKVAEANLTIASKTRDISAETARLARVAFLNRSGTRFDLVDTARRLREAELDLAIKEFEVLRAQIAALLSLATCRL